MDLLDNCYLFKLNFKLIKYDKMLVACKKRLKNATLICYIFKFKLIFLGIAVCYSSCIYTH